MEERLMEYLDQIMGYLQGAVELAQTEAPFIVQELLAFNTAQAKLLLWVFIPILTIVIAGYICYLFAKTNDRYSDSMDLAFGSFLFALMTIAPLVFIIAAVRDLIMIDLAPKLFIIEQVKNLL